MSSPPICTHEHVANRVDRGQAPTLKRASDVPCAPVQATGSPSIAIKKRPGDRQRAPVQGRRDLSIDK